MERDSDFYGFFSVKFFKPYMRAFLPCGNEAGFFQALDNFNARNKRYFHNETIIFSPVNSTSSFVSASKYSSMASLIFLIASSLVSPSDMQPGSEGTYAVNPP